MDTTHSTENSNIQLNSEERGCQFNTEKYLSIHAYPTMIPALNFIIENLIRIVNENKTRLGHDRALEFGGGPSLLGSFLLAQKIKSIVFADYISHNLTDVENWVKEKPNAHNWSDLFDRVIQEYQKQTEDMSVKRSDWEKQLREAIKHGGLFECDVNADDGPVLNGEPKHYNVVLSNQTYYIENEHRHPILSLNRTFVIEALRDAGFEDIHDESQNQELDKVADGNAVMIITAFKPKSSI
ncbi:unnamed protein product [Adineta steineri]|uniref:Uncharacterized protein n=1 Tax=Adineta steineri TaxID=433720 RepID=A0A813UHU0_9BILA|nr:unnamed protein product [Adineta steineri]CAF0826774.1 unnamed protein product [Adineta steineri]CAF1244849.1 unnamed protein product [Adineta steineri]